MYRRIEQIDEFTFSTYDEPGEGRYLKHGLCGGSQREVIDAWVDTIQVPKCGIPGNCRFYFTEKGWAQVGHKVVAACQKSGQRYRVIAIKENALDIVFRDDFQVAGQPKRKRQREGQKRRSWQQTNETWD